MYAHRWSNSPNMYMRGTKFKEHWPRQIQSSTANNRLGKKKVVCLQTWLTTRVRIGAALLGLTFLQS